MRLQGPHHVTMITADARGNVTFYGDVLGLRLVKRTMLPRARRERARSTAELQIGYSG